MEKKDKKDKSLPLVSVYVITYNSSETILETLESIYNQTYPKIELVISDDCSTDNTIQCCEMWLHSHSNRFVSVEVVVSPINRGISANVNTAWSKCNGEWIKGMAGDDVLKESAIENYIEYLAKNKQIKALFGKCFYISEDKDKISEMYSYHDYTFFSLSREEKLDYLIFKGCFIPCTTFIFNRETFLNNGIKCDERIPMLDDWPLWINILRSGIDLYYFDKEVVGYRIRENSMSTGSNTLRLQHAHSQVFLLYLLKPIWEAGLHSYAIRRYIQCKRKLTNNLFWIALYKLSKLFHAPPTVIVPDRINHQ